MATIDFLGITDVDLEMLEIHRVQLNSILEDDAILSTMTAEQQDALQGITCMLNAWSDALEALQS